MTTERVIIIDIGANLRDVLMELAKDSPWGKPEYLKELVELARETTKLTISIAHTEVQAGVIDMDIKIVRGIAT